MEIETSNTEMSNLESTKKSLFKIAMKCMWKDVIDVYSKDTRVHSARITRSGDTALHVAVSDGREDVVEKLVNLIWSHEEKREEALKIQNDRGNTALHFAASMGCVKTCQHIAEVMPSLVSFRNGDGETPLFLAALHGRKEAFLCLHYISCPMDREKPGPEHYSNCRREDGDTILHSAIFGDFFDLAFQIIHLYESLVNSVNQKGQSPLHLLASKPNAFKSATRLGRFETIVYHCIFVEKLQIAVPECRCLSADAGENKNRYPQNYQTCVELLRGIKRVGSVVTNKFPVTTFLIKKFCPKGDQTRIQTEDPEAQKQTATTAAEKKTIRIQKIRRKKEKHVWSVQIMNLLLDRASLYEYDNNGGKPSSSDVTEMGSYGFDEGDNVIDKMQPSTPTTEAQPQNKGDEKDRNPEGGKKQELPVVNAAKQETPILIAAKNGVREMVEKILELFPVAVHDMDDKKRNLVLLAVENRQPHLYELLVKRNMLKESLFRNVDKDGNSALHLAAKLGDYKPWLIPGAALQMQWELKWYRYVKDSMPPHFFPRYNKDNKTPRDIFSETHKDLVQSGGEWLNKTSEACSVVAALIATVAFATSSSVPGGVQESTGAPTLENKPAFNVFAIASLIALGCSVTSVVLFLSILTSRHQENDFGRGLPTKLILGLTSLFMSITSMLVSFCAGHFFVLKDKLRYAAFPVYALTCLPVTLFALAQFPLYFDLLRAISRKVPQRSYKTTLP